MRNIVCMGLLLIISLLYACQKDLKEAPSNKKEITEFKLEVLHNPAFLTEDIKATIEGAFIHLSVPQVVETQKLIATFEFEGISVLVGVVPQESTITPNDFSRPLTYTVTAEDGSTKSYTLEIEIIPELKPGMPHFYINIENGADIASKENYLKGNLKIDGAGVYEDYEGTTSIKGRGNSTWSYPKKPYRLKLDKKASLLGLSAEKDWILLANYLDGTLMLNAVALKTGRLLEMPYTNTIIPVDVTINGTYMGNYMFTEQKEVEDNRINVVDGVLLELDTYFDESYKFYSRDFKLPVMIQYPKLEKLPKADADVQFANIKKDFETLERAIFEESFPNNDYTDFLDITSLVHYLIVYDLTLNEEINHPKSTYIHKAKYGKYAMGPIWDFDWAFGYEGTHSHFNNPNKPLFWTNAAKGTIFFSRLMEDPKIKALYKKEWNQFKASKLERLFTYIDNYAEIIKESYEKDYAKWRRGSGNLAADVQKMKGWLNARAAYLDNYVAGW